jgi:hypothetical protein
MCGEKRRFRVGIGVLATLLVGVLPVTADFVSIAFQPLTSNSGLQNSLASQFNLRVEMGTGTHADHAAFTFSNEGAINANIAEIYWDWTSLFPDVLNPNASTGGYFNYDDPSGDFWQLEPPDEVNPWDLPGGGATWSTNAAADGASPEDPSGSAGGPEYKGLWTGEDPVTFYMGFSSGVPSADRWDTLVLTLTSPDSLLRFGLHVRSIGSTGDSDAFMSLPGVLTNTPDPIPVPVPGAAGLGLLGLGLVGVINRRRKMA